MGWRWWKTFYFGPLHATLSRRGIGWNIGTSFLRWGVGPSGNRYILVRIPGTGIGFIKYLGRTGQYGRQRLPTPVNQVVNTAPPVQSLPSAAPTLTHNQEILEAIKRDQRRD